MGDSEGMSEARIFDNLNSSMTLSAHKMAKEGLRKHLSSSDTESFLSLHAAPQHADSGIKGKGQTIPQHYEVDLHWERKFQRLFFSLSKQNEGSHVRLYTTQHC